MIGRFRLNARIEKMASKCLSEIEFLRRGRACQAAGSGVWGSGAGLVAPRGWGPYRIGRINK